LWARMQCSVAQAQCYMYREPSLASDYLANLQGATALHLASVIGNFAATDCLLEHSASINATNIYGRTPLMLAAMRGHTDIARLLFRSNAALATRDSWGRSPVHWAEGRGHVGLAQFLHSVQEASIPETAPHRSPWCGRRLSVARCACLEEHNHELSEDIEVVAEMSMVDPPEIWVAVMPEGSTTQDALGVEEMRCFSADSPAELPEMPQPATQAVSAAEGEEDSEPSLPLAPRSRARAVDDTDNPQEACARETIDPGMCEPRCASVDDLPGPPTVAVLYL